MDQTKQPSDAAAAISTNTTSSFQTDGCCSVHHEPQNPSTTPSTTTRKVHCDSCNMEFYWNSIQPATEIDNVSEDSSDESDGLPSPCYTTFSGVTLDQADHGQLSEFHILENDGRSETEADEWEAVTNEVGDTEKLQSLLKNGLAAVRVRVGSAHLQGFETQPAELSGFRLSQDMIITCAHFTDWGIAGNNVESFLDGKNGVCEAIQARCVKGGGLKNRFAIRLWAIHKAWDIAVFRITNWPKNASSLSVVRKEDIYLATPEDRCKLASAPQGRFWSVGYNVAVNLDDLRKRFAEFYSRRQHDEKMKIKNRYEYSDINSPGAKFLQANERTVSFGTRMGLPPAAKDHQACVELSAWHGRSGSMVCAEKDGSSVVIGIVQGGEANCDCNLILLFNTNMEEWLKAATELDAGQQDVSRRVIMA